MKDIACLLWVLAFAGKLAVIQWPEFGGEEVFALFVFAGIATVAFVVDLADER